MEEGIGSKPALPLTCHHRNKHTMRHQRKGYSSEYHTTVPFLAAHCQDGLPRSLPTTQPRGQHLPPVYLRTSQEKLAACKGPDQLFYVACSACSPSLHCLFCFEANHFTIQAHFNEIRGPRNGEEPLDGSVKPQLRKKYCQVGHVVGTLNALIAPTSIIQLRWRPAPGR